MKKYTTKSEFIKKNLEKEPWWDEETMAACWDLWEGKVKNVPRHNIDRVVSCFNEIRNRYREKSGIANKRFVSANPSQMRQIEGRFSEGATVEDAMLVMEYKFQEWWGAPPFREGDAPPRHYLNLATLFRPSNFPKYLLAAENWMDEQENKKGAKLERVETITKFPDEYRNRRRDS